MKYILDSDTISYLYDSNSKLYQTVYQRFAKLHDDDRVQVSLITVFELQYSIYNAPKIKKEQLIKQVKDIQQRFEVIAIGSELAPVYGQIKANLKKSKGSSTKGMRKYNIDLIVASTAISESSILVANDVIYQD